MANSIYIINPASDFPNYVSAEILAASGFAAGTAMADAAAATVAALASKDFQVSICDEYISPIDFDDPADWVAITGKVNQRRRMVAVADEFRRRGKRVVIGGPYASLSPAHLRRIPQSYARYYNEIRTYPSLNKDAPISRAVQRIGIVKSHAILGGLHHHYVRI